METRGKTEEIILDLTVPVTSVLFVRGRGAPIVETPAVETSSLQHQLTPSEETR